MFSDRLAQLLTGYIDGELSARKVRSVQRLLRRSPEARELLHQLEQDSRELQLLSRKTCEVDMASQVVRTINERQLKIKPRPVVARKFRMPAWVGYAAAAAVLVAVFYGSFQFSLNVHENKGSNVARNQDNAPPIVIGEKQQPAPLPPERIAHQPTPQPEPEKPQPTPMPQPEPERPVVVQGPVQPPIEPPTVEVVANPEPMDLGRPRSKMEVFEVVGNLNIVSDLTLRDLEQEGKQVELLQNLHKASSHRFELFSLGTGISFDQLEHTFNQFGIGFTIDKLCLYRMQNPYWQTDFAVYLENVKPEEAVALMTQLGQADRKLQGLVLPFSNDDHKELSRLLGIDPTKLDAPKPVKIDVREPISNATLKQLRNPPPRPQANGRPLLNRHALVVPCNPVHPNPSASREIKLFMDRRAKQEPGTVQLLFVIRGVSGS